MKFAFRSGGSNNIEGLDFGSQAGLSTASLVREAERSCESERVRQKEASSNGATLLLPECGRLSGSGFSGVEEEGREEYGGLSRILQ